MSPQLLHIYGPLYVNSYGLAIAIGLITFVMLCQRNPLLQSMMSRDRFSNIVILGIISALCGGRLWFALSEWGSYDNVIDLLKPWYGGFSVLGSIVGVLAIVPIYLRFHSIPVLPFFDIVALYTPLFHAIARIGCFYAGCCYGSPTNIWWGVTYTDTACMAPLNISLHPAQLYSSFCLVILYAILYSLQKYRGTGRLLMIYLIGAGIERCIVDLFRDDQTLYILQSLSINQVLALVFVIGGSYGMAKLTQPRIS